jgi:predicted transcriptional regulator
VDALREMKTRHLEALVVVIANDTLKGILAREAVVMSDQALER